MLIVGIVGKLQPSCPYVHYLGVINTMFAIYNYYFNSLDKLAGSQRGRYVGIHTYIVRYFIET